MTNRRALSLGMAALWLVCGLAALTPCGAAAAESAATAPATVTAAELIPVEAFARLPLVSRVVLSPDGQRLAALLNRGDETRILIRRVDGRETAKTPYKTDNREARFSWLHWVNNERLVVSVAYPSRRGWADSVETRLFSLHRDGGEMLALQQRRPVARSGMSAQIQDRVVDWMPDDGHHILLALDDEDVASPSVYRINVETGERRRVHRGVGRVVQWLTDRSHRVRVGVRQLDGRVDVTLCDPDGEHWRTAWSFDLLSPDAVQPLGFGTDPQQLYVLANHQGRRAVQLVDLASPKLPRRVLLSHPQIDLGGELMTLDGSGEVVGIHSTLFNNAAASFWQDETRALAQEIDKALPDRRNQLMQLSTDGSRYLLYSTGNGVPGEYLVGARDRGELYSLADTYPELAGKTLPKKTSLRITARDGVVLPSFLTLPLGREPKALPTVLLPHGGPISSDSVDFDPWVQFLASRGYAVLQVNFRGSAGYGQAHLQAGLKRWGLEMQDDLSDALQWLIRRGTADPARVCIVGASYGGYAALMGAAKTPELYRCVFSFAGISDLLELARTQRQFVEGEAAFERMVGSRWDDEERLEATSPRRLAGNIRAPVLLMHGSEDRSVPVEQSEMMARALRQAGQPVQLITLADGDHQLSHPAHRLQVFRELEAFLARNIGSAGAPAGAAKPP